MTVNLDYFLAQPGAILFALFLLTAILQLWFYVRYYLMLALYKQKGSIDALPPVSVVVPVYHYDKTFFDSLELVLKQDYEQYEVIVINVDTNLEVENELGRLHGLYPHLKLTFLPEKTDFSRKVALTLGAKAATYEWLLFLDSYCIVESSMWLKSFGEQMTEGKDVLIGYGNNKYAKGLWNHFLRLERFVRNMLCLSLTRTGKPCLCDGRNIAFRKKLFFENKGYAGLLNKHYAENELLAARFMRKDNVGIVVAPESFVRYDEYVRLRDYRELLKKHHRLVKSYRGQNIALVYLELLSRVLMYIFAILLLSSEIWDKWVAGVLVFRFILQVLCFKLIQNRVNERKLFISSLIYDVFSPVVFVFGRAIGLFKVGSSK